MVLFEKHLFEPSTCLSLTADQIKFSSGQYHAANLSALSCCLPYCTTATYCLELEAESETRRGLGATWARNDLIDPSCAQEAESADARLAALSARLAAAEAIAAAASPSPSAGPPPQTQQQAPPPPPPPPPPSVNSSESNMASAAVAATSNMASAAVAATVTATAEGGRPPAHPSAAAGPAATASAAAGPVAAGPARTLLIACENPATLAEAVVAGAVDCGGSGAAGAEGVSAATAAPTGPGLASSGGGGARVRAAALLRELRAASGWQADADSVAVEELQYSLSAGEGAGAAGAAGEAGGCGSETVSVMEEAVPQQGARGLDVAERLRVLQERMDLLNALV